ncbi:hypothetical protein ACFY03_25210 [Micromonospora chersina]|uniref:hypothetical protein n=1 Tax=Micromonospora chersina TaxID=47854 RepID=UPI0036A900DD
MGLSGSPLDPADQATLDAVYRTAVAAQAVDEPDLPPLCRRRFEAPLRHPMPGVDTRWWVARLDGASVGVRRLDHTLEREPELRVIDTFNAATNTHMIAINEQLGYRPAAGSTDWRLTI